MHARQRNVGSGSIGIGMMSSSRISPERPVRGHRFYGSEQQHRGGFNRGYGRGRGRSKFSLNQLPPPSPVQRRSGGDVFAEAGRLAAEYLVSQGALPQTVLGVSKWQKQVGEFRSSRLEEVARVDVSDTAADKRRCVDGYNSAGSRDDFKRRRSHRYDSDLGRSGSWSERGKAFEAETGGDFVSGNREEQPLAEDIASSVQRSASGEFTRNHEGAGDSDKDNLQDEAQSKTGSSSAEREIAQGCEISKVSEGSSSLSAGSGEMKGKTGVNVGTNETQTPTEDASISQHREDASVHQNCVADESFTKSGVDLSDFCRFEKVPTRTRSSLTAKGPKLFSSQIVEETSHGSEFQSENRRETLGQSSGKADCSGDENYSYQVKDLVLVPSDESNKCQRSNSFPNSILSEKREKDSGLDLPNLHRLYSVGKVGEKRPGECSEMEEGAKRQRDWIEPERFYKFKTKEIKCDPEEEVKTISFNHMRDRIQTGPVYAEERQLFPASFKICDLNLGGASYVNDRKKESVQAVDFDLSINSCSKSVEFGTSTRMSNGKEIEVIDLDDDSEEMLKSNNNPERKQEAAPYMSIDDVRGDYNEEGLTMVEYLDSFGNIPSLNQGISNAPRPPQNNNTVGGAIGKEKGVNNTDEDSIFMSLGEIPLTFLQTWNQPPARGYEKPF